MLEEHRTKAQEGEACTRSSRTGLPSPAHCWGLLLLLATHPTHSLRAQVWKCFWSCWK